MEHRKLKLVASDSLSLTLKIFDEKDVEIATICHRRRGQVGKDIAEHIVLCWNEHDTLKAKADSHDKLENELSLEKFARNKEFRRLTEDIKALGKIGNRLQSNHDELLTVLEKIKAYEAELAREGIGYDGHIWNIVVHAITKAKETKNVRNP
ncbi:hypothetical protein LCGC14_2633390 [marine sediment metagenome]|uniref:Uncharacterized protein n=1 Tax=marine sediment metagenome TaxID=412755 RepID=A0A0F8ZZU5_9ZZZZ